VLACVIMCEWWCRVPPTGGCRLTSGMLLKVRGCVVHTALVDKPGALLGVVLGHLVHREGLRIRLGLENTFSGRFMSKEEKDQVSSLSSGHRMGMRKGGRWLELI